MSAPSISSSSKDSLSPPPHVVDEPQVLPGGGSHRRNDISSNGMEAFEAQSRHRTDKVSRNNSLNVGDTSSPAKSCTEGDKERPPVGLTRDRTSGSNDKESWLTDARSDENDGSNLDDAARQTFAVLEGGMGQAPDSDKGLARGDIGPHDHSQEPFHAYPPSSAATSAPHHHGEQEEDPTGSSSELSATRLSLPPMDGGRRAWLFLAAATALETLVWGLPLSYGVFLAEYERRWQDSPNARTILAQVGTVSTGAMYLLLPPVAWLLRQRPHLRQLSMYLGLALVVASQIGAAFASTPGTLVATQGALYGLGGVALYAPATGLSFEWFRRRRGLASGIMYAGTGLGGLAGPFIVGGLIGRLGTRWALVTIGVAYGVALAAVVPFVKPRVAVVNTGSRWRLGRQHRRSARPQQSDRAPSSTSPKLDVDWAFLRGRAFWLLFAGVFFQALGGFVPGTYLPSYANEVALGTGTGTIALSLMNLARIPGQVALGHLADRGRPRRLILAMAIGSSTSVYLLWGLFAGSKPALLVFALCFGALAGSYTALFPRFIDIVQTAAATATNREPDPSLPQILYAFFSFSRGIGNIVAGPISTALLALPGSAGGVGSYAVHGYSLVIVFTGATLALSGIGAGYAGLKTS